MDPPIPPSAGHPIRKRMRRREVDGAARFVTFSCQRRLPLLGTPAARDIFARSLRESRQRFGFELLAWVAMPEHVHLLLRPPDRLAGPSPGADEEAVRTAGRPPGLSPLAAILKSLKHSAAQRLLALLRADADPLLGRILVPDTRGEAGAMGPRVWQKGGGFDRSVRSEAELLREIAYIHRNPVRRGLVGRPTDWRWSSARWWSTRHAGGSGSVEDAGPAQDPGDVPCDLPAGDPRRWLGWSGFM